MAATNDVVIENNDNSKQFLFRGVSGFRPKKSQPVQSFPLVNTTAANTVLFRFFGQSEEVTFTFALFDDSTDVSNGTGGSSIETVGEQAQYLWNDVYTDNFDVDWDLWDAHDLLFPSASAITGVITNLEFDKGTGSGAVMTGTLSFRRGRIGSL